MNIAVILAGSVGHLLDSSHPKQFFKVAEKTVIEHIIDIFEKSKNIDEIVELITRLFHSFFYLPVFTFLVVVPEKVARYTVMTSFADIIGQVIDVKIRD